MTLYWLFTSQVFKDTTDFFSSLSPNLAKVISAMDFLNKHLASSATSSCYNPAIQAILAVGKKLLNKYYNITDFSEVYHIMISEWCYVSWTPCGISYGLPVFHPDYKLQYFRSANWPSDWVNTAEEIVREEFKQAYANITINHLSNHQKVCLHCLSFILYIVSYMTGREEAMKAQRIFLMP